MLDLEEIFKFYKIDDEVYINKLYLLMQNDEYVQETKKVIDIVYSNDYTAIIKLWNLEYYELFKNEYSSNIVVLFGYMLHIENIKNSIIYKDQIDITINRVKECLYSNKGKTITVSQMLWATYFIKGKIIEIYNLQYELSNYNDYLNKEDKCFKIHIPRNTNFDINRINKSILEFKDIYKKYFKGLEKNNYDIICNTWLLSKEVLNCLNENDNINKFSKLFNIKDGENAKKDILKFMFNAKDSKEINDLETQGRLQMQMKEKIKKDINVFKGIRKVKINS